MSFRAIGVPTKESLNVENVDLAMALLNGYMKEFKLKEGLIASDL